ncbi:unnamed protein product [Moneuplotes crassus]|uniref:Uncharacterized protein n=1 Tax=Euplotes crassus TaxID=5936 RepID=A0AAD1ULR5_EUPCR|nr:unnamed protein product [Moneuplotes crassus]
MLNGFLVLAVAVLSVLFLHNKQHRHHWLGIFILFIGILLVAIEAMINQEDSATKNAYLGVPLLIISIFLKSVQYIVEEKLLSSYYLHPMKVVGWEGILGTIFYIFLLIILQFIPCNAGMCSNGVVEDTGMAFNHLSRSAELVIYLILLIILDGGMNGLGLLVTKHASAANRVTLTQVRTIIIWLFFMIVPLIFNLRVRESFHYLELIGFIVIIAGVILYNEIVTIPYLGLDRNCKKNQNYVNLGTSSFQPRDFDADITAEDDEIFGHHSSFDFQSEPNTQSPKAEREPPTSLNNTFQQNRFVGRSSVYLAMTSHD